MTPRITGPVSCRAETGPQLVFIYKETGPLQPLGGHIYIYSSTMSSYLQSTRCTIKLDTDRL